MNLFWNQPRVLTFSLSLLGTGIGSSAITITFYEDDSVPAVTSVVAQVEGTLDLNSLVREPGFDESFVPAVISGDPFFFASGAAPALLEGYFLLGAEVTGPTSISPSSPLPGSDGAGDGFAMVYAVDLNSFVFLVPAGASGITSISSAALWSDTTLADMQLAPGVTNWSWSGDSLQVNVVPEPSSSFLVAGAFLMGAFCRRRA